MAYTQTQLDALEAAIAAGVLEVRSGDYSVRYQSLDEMQRQREIMRGEIAAASSTGVSQHSITSFCRD